MADIPHDRMREFRSIGVEVSSKMEVAQLVRLAACCLLLAADDLLLVNSQVVILLACTLTRKLLRRAIQ